MKKILFQGDSITDAARERSAMFCWGRSYPFMIEAELGFEYVGEYEFINRGISGNRIVDLYARIKDDIINLKPDYISFLVGVNDVGHEIENQNGVDADKFEKIYCMLIEEIKHALPDVKIMIMEPFVLCGAITENTDEKPNRWELFRSGVMERADKARAVAEKYHLSFIPLQDKFDELQEKTIHTQGSGYWLFDGVHPTPKGHELLKREWLKVFQQLEKM